MAKKKPLGSDVNGSSESEVDELDSRKNEEDESPEMTAAKDAVCRAREELDRAEAMYQQLRKDATEKLAELRESKLGDVVDGTLDWVQKHPGSGVLAAALLGFFFGRIFRR